VWTCQKKKTTKLKEKTKKLQSLIVVTENATFSPLVIFPFFKIITEFVGLYESHMNPTDPIIILKNKRIGEKSIDDA
jgi:hypothetical protein